jgi:hypothetical protein
LHHATCVQGWALTLVHLAAAALPPLLLPLLLRLQ